MKQLVYKEKKKLETIQGKLYSVLCDIEDRYAHSSAIDELMQMATAIEAMIDGAGHYRY